MPVKIYKSGGYHDCSPKRYSGSAYTETEIKLRRESEYVPIYSAIAYNGPCDTGKIWWVRPAGSSYGLGTGATYADALAGNVELQAIAGSMNTGDAVAICGTHYETITPPIAGIYLSGDIPDHPGIIDCAPEITGTWELYSGNIYRIAVGTPNIDYYQETAPGSPTIGERWFRTGGAYTPSVMRGRIWTGLRWEYDPTWFIKPHQLIIDGDYYAPSRYPKSGFATGASISTTGVSYSGLSKADNYWQGATVFTRRYSWATEPRIISSSTGTAIVFPTMTYGATGTVSYFYIENCVGEISGFGSWAYREGYLYVDFGGDTPAQHTVKCSIINHGISAMSKDDITVDSLAIKNTNDAGVAIWYGNNATVQNCELDHIYTRTAYVPTDGAIMVVGDDWENAEPYNTFLWQGLYNLLSPKTGLSITGNTIANVLGGGNGIYAFALLTGGISNNIISNVGVDDRRVRPCGVYTEGCDGVYITGNSASYCGYSGILCLSKNTLIDSNVVDHVMLNHSDGGGIYVAGLISVNNMITNNLIKNVSGDPTYRDSIAVGIYLDNNTPNNTVTGNTIFNVDNNLKGHGILLNPGSNGNVVNNNDLYLTGATYNVRNLGSNTIGTNPVYAESEYIE